MVIFRSMSLPLSRLATLACAVLILLGADATASAQSKKRGAERTSTTTCDGAPVIMQGMDCLGRPARGEAQEEAQPPKGTKRPRVTTRGSSGPYVPSVQPTPSLALPQPSAGTYIPPPVNNPSERIQQYNSTFPLNGGLGNNPSNRDEYIRYNLNR